MQEVTLPDAMLQQMVDESTTAIFLPFAVSIRPGKKMMFRSQNGTIEPIAVRVIAVTYKLMKDVYMTEVDKTPYGSHKELYEAISRLAAPGYAITAETEITIISHTPLS